MGKAVAPMITNSTLCAFKNLKRSSVSMLDHLSQHLSRFLFHHFEAFLKGQRGEVIQFELKLLFLIGLG
jgi:hypothetical protein